MSWSNATSMASEVEPTPSRARAIAALPRSNVIVAFSLAIYFILPLGGTTVEGKDRFHDDLRLHTVEHELAGRRLPFLSCNDLAVFKAFVNRRRDGRTSRRCSGQGNSMSPTSPGS